MGERRLTSNIMTEEEILAWNKTGGNVKYLGTFSIILGKRCSTPVPSLADTYIFHINFYDMIKELLYMDTSS